MWVILASFLKQHWRGSLAVSLGACALGLSFRAGWAVGEIRATPRGVASTMGACDAGSNARAQVAESVAIGPSSCFCDAGTTVVWKQRPPVLVYLPGDAGPCLETVEEDVTIATSSSSSSTTGAVAVSVSVDAGAEASGTAVASVVVQAASGASRDARWSAFAGAGVTLQGQLAVEGGVLWNPNNWPVGVGILLDAHPAAPSQSSVAGVIEVRW